MKNFDFLNEQFSACAMNSQYLTSNGWVFIITGKHNNNDGAGTFWHVTVTSPNGEQRQLESKSAQLKQLFSKSSFARANKGTGNGAKGTPVPNNGTTKKISAPKHGVKLLSYDEMEALSIDMVQTYKYVQRCIARYKGTPLCSVIMHQQKKQRVTVALAKRKARQSIEYKQRLLDAQQRLQTLKQTLADTFLNGADMVTLDNLKTAINEQTALVNNLTKHIQ